MSVGGENGLKLRELILSLVNDSITEEQFADLQLRLSQDAEARKYYVEFIIVHLGLHQSKELYTSILAQSMVGDREDIISILNELVAVEESAETVEIEKPSPIAKPSLSNEIVKPAKGVSKWSLALALGSAAAMFIMLLIANFMPMDMPVVGTIIEMIDAKWNEMPETLEEGAELRPGFLRLDTGFALIRFSDGAEVTMQAPVEIELVDGNRLFLVSGRISCKVPSEAIGFIVQTAKASVIDYGTEFGISVDLRGNAETEVFEGEISLRSGTDPMLFDKEMRLKAGQSGLVNSHGEMSIGSSESRLYKYVREMPSADRFGKPGKRIDLADIVGGGNGFGTGKNDHVLSMETGFLKPRRHDAIPKPIGGRAMVTPRIPFVDCLFVPDMVPEGVVINSLGNSFSQCPDTEGSSYGDVANGGIVRHMAGLRSEMTLGEQRYGSAAKPAIFMHANMGITFDLKAIRNSIPGISIERFTSLCGISGSVLGEASSDGRVPVADFWVLVDGNVRFCKKGMKPSSVRESIDIALREGDRFLTLMVSDSDGTIHYDWGVFALAAIELGERR